jgi:signal transduction histidine kinase
MIRPWSRRSLRVRLMSVGLLGLAIALALGSVGLYAALSVESLRRVDRAAAATTAEVVALLHANRLPQTMPVSGVEVIQVVDDRGRVVSASVNADRLTSILSHDELQQAQRAPVTVSGARLGIGSRLRVRAATVDTDQGQRTVVVAEPIDDLTESSDALRLVLLVGYPVVLVLLALIAWRVIGAALRPVESLRAAAEGISGSRRDDRLPVPESDDEIHALAMTLNSMLDRLDRAHERERGFVADAAHELRSPLASMRMQIDVARRLGQGDEGLDDLDLEVARMSALVEDLLAMAKLDAARGVMPGAGSARVRDEVRRAAANWASSVRIDIEPGPDVEVAMRSDDLARVLDNLLGNAARYASSVRLSVLHHDDRADVYVDDDGPGITPADRERAFDRFTRLDESRDRGSGGAGLGLAIVRGTVTSYGGDVRLGESPLGGLRVRVELPASVDGGYPARDIGDSAGT